MKELRKTIERRFYQLNAKHAEEMTALREEHQDDLEKACAVIDRQQQTIEKLRAENSSLITVVRALCRRM